MPGSPRLVGRERERLELAGRLGEARKGSGSLLLVAGEAGVGKTRLVEEVLRGEAVPLFAGVAVQGNLTPYGPVIQVLRSRLDRAGGDASALGPLAFHLGILLPELGVPPGDGTDGATLLEAIRRAVLGAAAREPAAVLLEDLQWADDATLELLVELGGSMDGTPLLLVGTYRGEELPPAHPLRRLRSELRRRGRLRELALEPLSRAEAEALASEILPASAGPSLAQALFDRSQGIPFFIEELAAALVRGNHLQEGVRGLEVTDGSALPLPESLRDAVLLRTQGLSPGARRALETAAVVGDAPELDLLEDLCGGEEAITELLERGLLLEGEEGRGAFRHALVREAVHHAIPWPRRRAIHRRVAAALEARGGGPERLALHWSEAREPGPARRALVASAEAYCRVHAYRDGVRAYRKALELPIPERDEAARLRILDRLARCAELSGDLTAAAQAWSEVAEGRKRDGNLFELGEIQRRLGAVHGLQGAWERAAHAHRAAAEAFAEHGLPAEAASERLVAADLLEAAGRRGKALELTRVAGVEAGREGRRELELLAQALEGQLRVQLGEGEEGLGLLRGSLSRALEENLAGAAAGIYYRLALALGEAGDYRASRDAYREALAFCQARGIPEVEHQCLACFAGVLVETGEWGRAASLCRELLASPEVEPPIPAVAAVVGGILEALRGRTRSARRRLEDGEAELARFPILGLELSVLWGLALVEEQEGAPASAAERLRSLRERWEGTDDLYYVIHPLRWGASFLAANGRGREVRASANVLASVAARKGSPEALAALAHALGECLLLEGEAVRAADHFDRALRILARLELPFQRAHTEARAGAALVAAGDRDGAVQRLLRAYHTARKLGARPLALRTAGALRDLGEPVERRLGKRIARRLDRAGLTPRELQVLGLVERGLSNREIARELFLSIRTVEMHVSNALHKLGSVGRTEAVHRARELGVIP